MGFGNESRLRSLRLSLLILKLLFFTYLGYLVFFLAVGYEPTQPDYHPPFVLWIVDTINLFIHEAGHFFFRPFGMWVHIIAGSFFQCLIPGLLLLVTWRQNVHQIALPAFWLGENLVNVSVYIRDAPFRQLKLIGKGLIHDWNWLLTGNLGAAEPLGVMVFGIGVLICAAAVGAGGYFALGTFRTAPSAE